MFVCKLGHIECVCGTVKNDSEKVMISNWPQRPVSAPSVMQMLRKKPQFLWLGSTRQCDASVRASFRQSINTEIWDVTMTAKGCFSSRPKVCEEVNGLLMRQHRLIQTELQTLVSGKTPTLSRVLAKFMSSNGWDNEAFFKVIRWITKQLKQILTV